MALYSNMRFILIVLVVSVLMLMYYNDTSPRKVYLQYKSSFKKPSDFKGFNNEDGLEEEIIPNFVHFLRFNQAEFTFLEAICILSAVKNQNPDRLYIHTNIELFSGKYWKMLLDNPELRRILLIEHIELPKMIFNQPYSEKWHIKHASDVEKFRILMNFGGIYLDLDTYVVQNLDRFRSFEMVLNWDYGEWLATQILIAHPKARFLQEYLESYRDHYHAKDRYFNSGERPTQTILNKKPNLIHRVHKSLFGIDTGIFNNIYLKKWSDWKSYYCINLLIKQRSYLDPDNYNITPVFNETISLNYVNVTLGIMVRDVLRWHNRTIRWEQN